MKSSPEALCVAARTYAAAAKRDVWARVSLLAFVLAPPGRAARLYVEDDPVAILGGDTLKQTVRNSSTAWLVQFYSSWCGHCIQYSPTWRALAGDVKDWELAIRIGVLDCAHERNFDICKEFEIHFYPTFRYFKAHPSSFFSGANRELQTVRQLMVNILQNHTRQDWPVHCPPLGPARSDDILALMGKTAEQYTALIVEDEDSYVGREVILDLVPYRGLTVRRALSSDKAITEKLRISTAPAAYLFYPNGSHGALDVPKRQRFFFSSFLKLLPGVRRKQTASVQDPVHTLNKGDEATMKDWKEFDRSKVYMADLESGLHYLLRVELASHHTLEGEELVAFKDFVTVVAKLFPGRQPVVKLLETLLEWLTSLPLEKIPYDAILDLVNNKMRISGLYLTDHVQWVSCQGSSMTLRGYPCSLWTLFHILTAQAAQRPDALANTGLFYDPQAVLQTMRRYITTFFGCQECGKHFEAMAKESMNSVKSLDEAVLWLWRKHNQVNSRLAGAMSEDPVFPKTQWPTPDLCPTCHEEQNGLHVWKEDMVQVFLKKHYSAANISPKYSSKLEQLDIKAPPAPGSMDKAPLNNQGTEGDKQAHEDLPKKGKRSDPKDTMEEARNSQRDPRPGVNFLGLGFSSVDMSLCVVLYAFSCLFLMLMFFFFRIRSKRWKIKHSRPYV
uniref:Sulfhydryl oxidase n=1 Tax=Denticeps clupeoides TaxID=299321 RepID=A0AAY4EZ02_9TELE